ncbi:MAG: LssY C-terminal domain-containing protein [Myxococcaceae bacterium]
MPRINPSKPAAPATPKEARFSIPTKGQWAQNIKGDKSDPVNVYVHGSLEDVRAAFLKAGWLQPVPKSTKSMLEYGGAAAVEIGARGADHFLDKATKAWNDVTRRHDKAPHVPHPTKDLVDRMPIAHLFMNGKPDVLSFEKGNDPTGGRHHFRVFDTGQVDDQGKKVWAITASLDVNTVVALDRPEQMFINHIIDKNADKERDEVLRSLQQANAVGKFSEHKLPFGDPAPTGLHSEDGRVFDVVLK